MLSLDEGLVNCEKGKNKLASCLYSGSKNNNNASIIPDNVNSGSLNLMIWRFYFNINYSLRIKTLVPIAIKGG